MRVLMHGPPHAMSAELRVDAVAGADERGTDGGRDVPDAMVRGTHADGGVEGRTGGVDEALVVRVGGIADDEGDRAVGNPSVDRRSKVETEQVPVAQGVVVR